MPCSGVTVTTGFWADPASITYRIALCPHHGRKAFTAQPVPAVVRGHDNSSVAKAAGFSLHAGVAREAHEREKLQRLCRYVTRPAVSTERWSRTTQGNIRYRLKTPYRGAKGRMPGVFPGPTGGTGADATRQLHPLPRRKYPVYLNSEFDSLRACVPVILLRLNSA